MNIIELNQNEVSSVSGGGLITKVGSAIGFCGGVVFDTYMVAKLVTAGAVLAEIAQGGKKGNNKIGGHVKIQAVTALALVGYSVAGVAIAWAGGAVGTFVGAMIDSLTSD